MAPPEIFWVAQPLRIVRADVQHDRQGPHRMDAADEGVERKLANRNAHTADALVADAEDAAPVRGKDDVHFTVRAVSQQLGYGLAQRLGDEEATRSAVDVTELLARQRDDWCINNRHHFFQVFKN